MPHIVLEGIRAAQLLCAVIHGLPYRHCWQPHGNPQPGLGVYHPIRLALLPRPSRAVEKIDVSPSFVHKGGNVTNERLAPSQVKVTGALVLITRAADVPRVCLPWCGQTGSLIHSGRYSHCVHWLVWRSSPLSYSARLVGSRSTSYAVRNLPKRSWACLLAFPSSTCRNKNDSIDTNNNNPLSSPKHSMGVSDCIEQHLQPGCKKDIRSQATNFDLLSGVRQRVF